MLDVLCNIEKVFSEACNCSFFYWSRVLVGPYFTDIFNHPEEAQKLQYMFAAFRDIVPMFNTVIHLDPKEFISIYDAEVTQSLENNLILPVCRAIEEDLRFHIHTHLDVSIRDPFKQGVKDLRSLIHIKPLRFFNRMINVKGKELHPFCIIIIISVIINRSLIITTIMTKTIINMMIMKKQNSTYYALFRQNIL